MRTMYDSVSPWAIPADAEMVAGYVDGLYMWKLSDWARFPHAVKVRIAVHASTNDGHVLDCELGDATPAQCPGWAQMRRAAGVDPTVYCSYAVWPEVQQAFARAGVPQPHYWVAAYPGNGAQLYDGAVAHQYADRGPNGENVDISVVADYWPGVDPPPTPPPASKGKQVHPYITIDGVTIYDYDTTLGLIWQVAHVDGTAVVSHVSQETYTALAAALAKRA